MEVCVPSLRNQVKLSVNKSLYIQSNDNVDAQFGQTTFTEKSILKRRMNEKHNGQQHFILQPTQYLNMFQLPIISIISADNTATITEVQSYSMNTKLLIEVNNLVINHSVKS